MQRTDYNYNFGPDCSNLRIKSRRKAVVPLLAESYLGAQNDLKRQRGRTDVENNVLSRETPIRSGKCRSHTPIHYAYLLAAMFALSIVGTGAQTLIVTGPVAIASPTPVGDVHIREGGVLTVIGPNGNVTGTPNPVWQIGDVSGTQNPLTGTGTLDIVQGGIVTLKSKGNST